MAADSSTISRIEDRQEALIRGVAKMNETLGIHSAILEQILEAATKPPPKSNLGEILKRIATLLTEHQEALNVLDGRLANLPKQIADALTLSGRLSS